MTVNIPAHRTRRHYAWWLFGILSLVAIFTVGRLIYPRYRQRQLITELTARGFSLGTRQIHGDWREDWGRYLRLPRAWLNAYRQEFVIGNPNGTCTPEDFALLAELVSWDEEWFHSPSRTWIGLTLNNATDRELAQLQPRVQYLQINGPAVSDDGLSALQRTPYLSSLDLQADQIGDRGFAHLSGLTALINLQICSRHVSDTGLGHLAGLTKMRRLDLRETHITDAGLAHLAGLTQLEHLCLSNAQLTGNGCVHLSKMTRLFHLDLTGNPIEDAELVHLPSSIMTLRLGRSKVTEAGLNALARLPNLRVLDLSDTTVTNAGLADRQRLPLHLSELRIQRTQVTQQHVRALQKADPCLRIHGP